MVNLIPHTLVWDGLKKFNNFEQKIAGCLKENVGTINLTVECLLTKQW